MGISLLSPIQSAFKTAAIEELKERAHLGWKDDVMLAAIISCVINAVQSFFCGFLWMGCSFLFLTGVSVFASYYVHYFNDGETLQKSLDLLREENGKMKKVNADFSKKTQDLENECKELERVKADLQGTVEHFQQQTNELATSNEALDRHAQQTREQVSRFADQNHELYTRIADLDTQTRQMTRDCDETKQQNQALTASLTKAQSLIDQLSAEKVQWEESLQRFSGAVHQDTDKMSQELARSREITGQIEKERDLLSAELKEIKETLGSLDSLKQKLIAQELSFQEALQKEQISRREFDEITKKIQEKTDENTRIQTQIRQDTEKLERVLAGIKQEEEQLENVRKTAELVVQNFSANQEKMQKTASALEERILHLKEQATTHVTPRRSPQGEPVVTTAQPPQSSNQ